MTYQQQEQLQRQALALMVKAISAEIDAASERKGKELAARFSVAVNSKDDLAKALGVAFIEGATYVFKRMSES